MVLQILVLCLHSLPAYTALGPGSVRRASGLSIMIGPVIPSEISGIRQKWNTKKMPALISSLPHEPVAGVKLSVA